MTIQFSDDLVSVQDDAALKNVSSSGRGLHLLPPGAGLISGPLQLGGDVVFIDARVPDLQALLAGVNAGVRAFVINSESDGLQQIANILAANHLQNLSGISIVTRDPSRSTIEGHDALRAYIENALRFAAEVRYRLSATYTGTDSIVIVYACTTPDGQQKAGSDLMRVDDTGKVVEWRCHY